MGGPGDFVGDDGDSDYYDEYSEDSDESEDEVVRASKQVKLME